MGVSIIAEVGECFNGDIENALKMVDAAAEAECDIVKFQLLDMSEVAKDDPEYDWFNKLDLPLEKIKLLKKYAIEKGLDILFTPVSIKTAETMILAGEKKVKIASSFIRKKELLEFINDNFETVYMSTGMAELDEIRDALKDHLAGQTTNTKCKVIQESKQMKT